jgi:hypothetical protein
MCNAGGGGICDCGDAASWNPLGNCSDHSGVSTDSADDPTLRLPPDVQRQAPPVFEMLLGLIGSALINHDDCWLVGDAFVDRASGTPGPGWCMVLLHNDDHHGFDQVIKQVVKAVRCDIKRAEEVATRADQTQRACVCLSPTRTECERVQKVNIFISLSVPRLCTSTSGLTKFARL